MGKLDHYDGREIIAFSTKLTNAGDGLSKAMQIEPKDLHIGDLVYLVVEGVVVGDNLGPAIKDNLFGPLALSTVIRAGTATFVDASFAQATIDEQASKNRDAELKEKREKEAEAGVMSMPVDGLPRDDEGFYDPALDGAGDEVAAKRSHKRKPAPDA